MSKTPIRLCITDIRARDEIINNEKKYIVYIYGITDNNKRVVVIVNNFKPYFFLKLPKRYDADLFKSDAFSIINKHIETRIKMGLKYNRGNYIIQYDNSCKNSFLSEYSNISKKNDLLVGYSGGRKMRALKLVFSNETVMLDMSSWFSKKNKIKDYIKKNNRIDINFSQCLVYDDVKCDNILKMCHTSGINPTGWIYINNYNKIPKNKQQTKQEIEISCSHKNIFDIRTLDKSFDITQVPKLLLLSYDIECDSTDGHKFPMAKNPYDKIIQIGTVFRYLNEKKSMKYNVILKSVKDSDGKNYSKTAGAKIIECNTEKELLITWAKLVEKYNPDILYGYNTHGFDDEYIYARASRYNISDKLLSILSRDRNWESRYTTKYLSSSGMGQNYLKYMDITGRITIDIMKEIKKNPTYRLPSYKLDDVAYEFLKEKKNDVDPEGLFFKYKRGRPDDIAIISDYCIQDCELVHNLVDYLAIIHGAIGMSRVCHVPLTYIFFNGQGIRILSLLAYELRNNDTLIQYNKLKEKGGYSGAIVLPPTVGIYTDYPVVVIDFNSLYPSIMIAHNISHDTILLSDKYNDNPNLFETLTYNEKIIGEGKKDISYKKHNVEYLRYNKNRENMGIIPKILQKLLQSRKDVKNEMFIISDQISILKKIKKEGIKCINYIETHANDILESRINNININITDGIIKILLNNNTLKCKNTKYFINKTILELSIKERVLNALQLSYKVTANSVYGQCGASVSEIYCKDMASTVTALGQHYIKVAKKHVETNYNAVCVYGDTDSIFIHFKFPIKNSENKSSEEIRLEKLRTAKNLGIKVSDEITKLINRNPLRIVYEKAIFPLILVKKKDYCGLWHEEDINVSKFKMMGSAPKKRNYAPILTDLFMGIVNKILYSDNLNNSVKEAMAYFYNECVNLKKYDLDKFVITKSLKSGYKNPKTITQKVLADKIKERDPGKAPSPGTRLQYVFIKINAKECDDYMLKKPGVALRTKGQNNKLTKEHIYTGFYVETPEYISKNNLKIDYNDYIIKQISRPILNILRLRFINNLGILEYLFYKIITNYTSIIRRVKIRIAITPKKMPDGTIEKSESAELKLLKTIKNMHYIIHKKNIKYINFIPDFKNDVKSGLVQIIN